MGQEKMPRATRGRGIRDPERFRVIEEVRKILSLRHGRWEPERIICLAEGLILGTLLPASDDDVGWGDTHLSTLLDRPGVDSNTRLVACVSPVLILITYSVTDMYRLVDSQTTSYATWRQSRDSVSHSNTSASPV